MVAQSIGILSLKDEKTFTRELNGAGNEIQVTYFLVFGQPELRTENQACIQSDPSR
jgi:hypothetical protein